MNYRCDSCGRRRSGRFRRRPTCCGREMRNDTKNVVAWNRTQETCDCGTVPFKHRLGSRVGEHMCSNHPEFNPWGNKYGEFEE